MTLTFERWRDDPIAGTLELAGAWRAAFLGWVQLIQAVEEAREIGREE